MAGVQTPVLPAECLSIRITARQAVRFLTGVYLTLKEGTRGEFKSNTLRSATLAAVSYTSTLLPGEVYVDMAATTTHPIPTELRGSSGVDSHGRPVSLSRPYSRCKSQSSLTISNMTRRISDVLP